MGRLAVLNLAGARMELRDAFGALDRFSGQDLTQTLSQIEASLQGTTAGTCCTLLSEHHASPNALIAAGLVKRLAGQINVVLHALGILLSLPKVLQPGEIVESVSLGAGNTGKPFDLETDRRIAEFKFIAWQGGPESIRQNSLFKDFYCLAESGSTKSKHLYVVGKQFPLRFLNGRRALRSVLSKNVKLYEDFRAKYPDYRIVRDYYLPRRDLVSVEDVAAMLPELSTDLA